ncbi:MAG: hypothetical protein F4Z18_00185 [Caldilineaceae bacterium SB0666_bin_21]|nr:hypothetical protein [Caldilineaceae bacterium SB0666_bin_21]
MVRLKQVHPEDEPVFQWFDPNLGIWRDALGDKRRESEERGKESGRAQTILTVVDHILSDEGAVDAIAQPWHVFRVPGNTDDLLTAVLDNPAKWREIFGITTESEEGSELDGGNHPSAL